MLHGITDPGFSVLGDSISTLAGFIPAGWRVHYEGEVQVKGITEPRHTWWGQVIDHFGGHLTANSSFSGSCVEGFGFPAGCSPERLAALRGPAGQAPDVVLVYMGINDFGWGGARNQTLGRSKSASARPEDLPKSHRMQQTVGPEAVELFARTYDSLLEGVRSVAPQAQVWCVGLAPGTPPPSSGKGPEAKPPQFAYRLRGQELEAYNQAIRKAAQAHDAGFVDMAALNFCYDAVDGAHPSALGMEQIAQTVISSIQGSPTSRLEELISQAPAPQRTCFLPTCEGCPRSPVGTTSWGLHCMEPSVP